MGDSNSTASAADRNWPVGERGAFSDDALSSWTLPSRYYTDAGIHGSELRKIFERSWCYVGHVTDIPSAGSYFTDEVAHQPIVVVRGRDDHVRAFYNVCQHRGHILLKGRGTLTTGITCPYHAWNYGLDGMLKNAPMTGDVAGFDKTEFPLRPVPLAIVAGLIFVNLDKLARPFEEEAPGFEGTIRESLPGMATFAAVDRLEFDIAANWKIVIDNFSEGYHIPIAHPALAKLHGRRTTSSAVGEKYGFFRGVGRTSYDQFAVKPDEPYLTWWLWPNFCMLSLPGSEHVIVLRAAPDGPGRCRERADIYAPAGNIPPNLAIVRRLFAEMFNREDMAIVENVQRGISSLGYDQSRYVVDKNDGWYSESALHRFHAQVLRALEGKDE
ncbi:MAG: aromatic ring-hydroxylating oxygenase subunit alpha [Dongiaceae bacterium]